MRRYTLVEFLVRGREARYDLTGSTVPPLTLRDLGIDADEVELGYSPSLGSDALRSMVSDLYGVEPSQVIVTMGASEANNVAFLTMLGEGPALIERPYFEPLFNVPDALGARVDAVPGERFVGALAGGGYSMAILANPNNPGEGLHDPGPVIEAAADTGAAVLFDEIYLPFVEGGRSAMEQASERAMVSCSLSKVAGLGGIRLGWLVVTPDLVAEASRVKMNLNPTNTALGEMAAVRCLEDLGRVQERARRIVREGRASLMRNVSALTVPEGVLPFAYCRYTDGPPSLEVAERLLTDHDICVLAGECFGGATAFRVATGGPSEGAYKALDIALTEQGVRP
ncbi:MAG: pyridoxal phosphate-dependent aminotransferase [Thermoplasmata archaeon]|nr:pyridoxal phosphate-dependent aminotransferase [Thermoplasmata archaeon]